MLSLLLSRWKISSFNVWVSGACAAWFLWDQQGAVLHHVFISFLLQSFDVNTATNVLMFDWTLIKSASTDKKKKHQCLDVAKTDQTSNLGYKNEGPCTLISCLLLYWPAICSWHACYWHSHTPSCLKSKSSSVCALWSLSRHTHSWLCSISDKTEVFPFLKKVPVITHPAVKLRMLVSYDHT